MPLPVNSDAYQVRLIWRSTLAPRPASNNLYFEDTAGGQTAVNLNTDLNAAVTASMWTIIPGVAKVTDVVITPLDGTTAGLVFPTGSPAKWGGSAASDMIPQGAAVVSVKTYLRGPKGRGRIYLPWISEGNQLNGVLDAANIGTMQTAWNTFFGAMLGFGWQPVVPNVSGPLATPAVQYVLRPYLKSQRRRALR